MRFPRLLEALNPVKPARAVHAHCDIPCGVYDPEQARIEAESCLKIIEKYQDSTDDLFRQRCVVVKEERAELAKHHIDVLWSDYYKPGTHDADFPAIKDVFNQAAKQCSEVKRTTDKAAAEKLLSLIDQIDEFWKKTDGPATTRVSGRPG